MLNCQSSYIPCGSIKVAMTTNLCNARRTIWTTKMQKALMWL
uniref:Uncharacterized protein n=1 Tax=Rhizophora mucronata TaxID=61149 RepID=A0A2P2NN90_RHIMU